MSEENLENVESDLVENNSQANDPVQYTDIEKKAMAYGHVPKDQYKGDPDKYIPAEDFIRNYTWVKEIKNLKGELSKSHQAIESLVDHNKKVEAMAYAKAKSDLEKRLEDAVITGDIEQVKNINKNISELQQPQVKQNNKPEYESEFESRNHDWYNGTTPMSQAMTRYAIAKDRELFKEIPNSNPRDHLRRVEEEVKAAFPGYFKQETRMTEKVSSTSKVESGTSTPNKQRSSGLKDLPSHLQSMAETLKNTTKNFDEAGFIRQWKDMNI